MAVPIPAPTRVPTLAVWKFASCDGCQLTLLDCEDELLAIAGAVRIAHFPEASRATVAGPYDVSLVEGSVTTPGDVERLRQVREQSRYLVAIGACATTGGIQALRNFADIAQFRSVVYARPEYLSTLDTSTPAATHVPVDLELPGCPIDRRQLVQTLTAILIGRRPDLPGHSVCVECKARGTTCVLVAGGAPCLGPVTRAGCGALCPTFRRGCFGCFGPADTTNASALIAQLRLLGMAENEVQRVFRTFNVAAFEPVLAGAATDPDRAADSGPDPAGAADPTGPAGVADPAGVAGVASDPDSAPGGDRS